MQAPQSRPYGAQTALVMQASLVRGHQWITSANILLISLSSLFLSNTFSDLLMHFTILHAQSAARTEMFHTLLLKTRAGFKAMNLVFLSPWSSPRGCTDGLRNPSSAVPACLVPASEPGFRSRILRKGQAGKLTASKLMLSVKRLWKCIFTNWWK